MRETYVVSFEKNTVTQARLVKAESAEQAKAYFAEIEPTATVYGVTVDNVGYARRGMPCEVVPDGWAEQPAQEAQEDQEEGNTTEENRLYCKGIADELEAYDTGSVWKCPECGAVENADATYSAPAVMVPPGGSAQERLAKCNKAELKAIAAELDTVQRRLERLLFWGL